MVESGGVAIRPLEEENGVRVTDRIERRSVVFRTKEVVKPEPVDCDMFPYPVDAAVSVTAEQIILGESPAVYIYDKEGNPLDDLKFISKRQLDEAEYFIQVESALKIYLNVEGPLSIESDPNTIRIQLSECQRVLLGGRRHHERPVGTITTTENLSDIVSALSFLGSSLKTASPRRSYPSLRGHPPAIELGSEFAVPDEIDLPDSDITIEVPHELSAAFIAAPLAHYLPADLQIGNEARILISDGYTYPLEGGDSFQNNVERVLKQTFILDCVVREEITTRSTLETSKIAGRLPFEIQKARDQAPAERLKRYLKLPFDAVADCIPTWNLVARVQPTADRISVLPFLVDDFAIIKSTPRAPTFEPENFQPVTTSWAESNNTTRGGNRGSPKFESEFVDVPSSESIEQAWVGDGIPVGATKTFPVAFQNRVNREESDGEFRIGVVCNDDGMLEEGGTVGEVYRTRKSSPLDVSFHNRLTCEEFTEVLNSDFGFLHYVGHIEEEGFKCRDGWVDVEDLGRVGIDSFVLNACRSYEQGASLVNRGAIGGVVTLDRVINSGAVRVGKTMARLLKRGFPIRPALDIARRRSVYGSQYLVVGDGNFGIAPVEGLGPALGEIQTTPEGYHLSIRTYPTRITSIGSVFRSFYGTPDDTWLLVGSPLATFHIDDPEELQNYLNQQVKPVVIDGDLTWSDRIDLEAYPIPGS